MSADHERELDQIAGLVLGALDDADRREIERHLATGCAVCERELSRLSETPAVLAAGVAPAMPPPALRRRVLAAALAERPAGADEPMPPRAAVTSSARPRKRHWTPALAIAAALIAMAMVATWREAVRLRGELETARAALVRSERERDELQRWLALLDSPDAQVVDLELTPAGARELRVRATVDSASRRAVVVFAHARLPEHQDYQLWSIGPSGPNSLGVVRADASGHAVVRIADIGDPAALQAIAVSLEARGGSPHPRAPAGPVVMVGKIGG